MTRTTSPQQVYDDFTGPGLDMSRWFHLSHPGEPGGQPWTCREPGARTDVGGGTLTVRVERFERGHDRLQMLDNPKHLLLSAQSFAVPAAGRLTVAAEMAVTSINARPRDYRDGFAAMNVVDTASGWVFDLCATSDTVFSIHERLPLPGVARPFSHIVEEPQAGLDIAPGRAHRYEVTLDAARGAAAWRVDGHLVFDAQGIEIPARVHVGMGLFTLHPITGGRSTSVRGQGLSASFGPISVTPA